MGSSSPEVAKKIIEAEYEGDRIKVQNLTLLNEAFSTPIDREDIHRAIINLDEIINSCKTIVVEMDADLLGVKADKFCIEMAAYLREGAEAIAAGYGKLGSDRNWPRRCRQGREGRQEVHQIVPPGTRRVVPGQRFPQHLPPQGNLYPVVARGFAHERLQQHAARHRRQADLNSRPGRATPGVHASHRGRPHGLPRFVFGSAPPPGAGFTSRFS
jgi:hypothetical protein